MLHAKVLIIDFGSPYTQLIARKVREAGVYSAILPCNASTERIKDAKASAIILSGTPEDTFAEDAPVLPSVVTELGIPVLGIGHGMQVLAKSLGGILEAATHAPYEEVSCTTVTSPLWKGVAGSFRAWMSSSDRIATLPQGFSCIASTNQLPIAAIANEATKLYGVQFHPEAEQTEAGLQILHNFLFDIAGLTSDWTMATFIDRTVAECKQTAGDSNVVLGLSGGVDSTVVAALLHKAIGSHLHCIFVDTGLMRHNEPQEVADVFKKHMPDVVLHSIDAKALFLSRLAGVDNPEEKRKIIGYTFIEVFEQEAKKIENVRFLAQGTIYPDIIESYSPKGVVIKSHHNVGGLPDIMNLDLIEPLKELFKDEVRAVGEELGLPEDLIWRQPFPGPGLAVRVLGDVSEEKLAILRAADHIVTQELRSSGWYRKIWQGFAIILPLRTVGMREDARTYEHVIALRMVNSKDAMTAQWAHLPYEVLENMSSRILKEVKGVNRVVFDISSKPPSTIEWE